MAEVKPLKPLKDEQATAVRPGDHAWVSASAGTGKTQVLTARVLRLLLHGADPSAILCVTFTKAGAAEMAERINSRLAYWVRAKELEVGRDLFALGEASDASTIVRARKLFAKVLEAPGGLRVLTIHSFAQSLLASFPLEAGVTPGFTALDERSSASLRGKVLAEVLVAAERGDLRLIEDMQALSLTLGEARVAEVMRTLVAHGEAIREFRTRETIEPQLRRIFGVPIEGDRAAVMAAACAMVDCAGLARFAKALADDGGATAVKRASRLAAWLELDARGRVETLSELYGGFLTAKLEKFSQISTAAMRKDAAIEALGERLADACLELLDIEARFDLATRIARSLRVGWTLSGAYDRAKARAGVIDYDDMIARASGLLASDGMGAWVRYKLDQRIQHILVDEGQDTNRGQWTIVEALTGEFFAGQDAANRRRTLFAVGDFKQAIFSFQGTDPKEFEDARRAFQRRAKDADERFHDLDLRRSFRSTEAVLQVVDALVATLGHEALGLGRPVPEHVPHRAGAAGQVTLWKPVVAAEEGEDAEEGWVQPSMLLYADRLAAQIEEWLAKPLWLKARGRRLRAEDILILVRSRGDFVPLLVARLHERRVPVTGIDRLRLTTPLAVQDILALVRFALQPRDDLTLATLLVSPLLGWSQEALFELAHDRSGSLWDALDGEARAWLGEVLRMADYAAPFEFIERMLSGPLDGRRRLLSRLGAEARDPIDELLNAALAFEQANPPSLQGFLDWIEREDVEVKRDPSGPRDAVRIMTVHGAKGLQAPLVILADATSDPDNKYRDHVLMPLEGGPPLPLHPGPKAGWREPIASAMAAAAARDRQEHWRLLYVALTRAEDMLFVGGALGPRARGVVPANSWHARVEEALAGLGGEWQEDALWGASLDHASGRAGTEARERRRTLVPPRAIPDWARAAPAPEESPPRPLSPSSLGEDDVADPPRFADNGATARRGTLLHALFERLPAIAPAQRRATAEAWLSQPGRAADADERASLIDAALGVIEHGDFANLFGQDALAEAPIAALVGNNVVAGTVDRLLVGAEEVLVVDFKTGSRVPAVVEEAPVYHLRQMAAYAAALRVIFPERRVRAALLYTAGPVLLPLPDKLLAVYAPSEA